MLGVSAVVGSCVVFPKASSVYYVSLMRRVSVRCCV